jgi:hypothetical protein
MRELGKLAPLGRTMMNINAWGKLAAIGCVAAMVGVACNSSSGGGSAGAAGVAGQPATGGTGATAGSGGTGGTAGMPATGGTGGMPADGGACMNCIMANCSGEWAACDSTCQTDFQCIQNCTLGDAGTGTGMSVGDCAQTVCNVTSANTSALVGCIDDTEAGADCNAECFGGATP